MCVIASGHNLGVTAEADVIEEQQLKLMQSGSSCCSGHNQGTTAEVSEVACRRYWFW